MKRTLIFLVVTLFVGCHASGSGSVKLSKLIMPASVYSGVSDVEIALVVNDVNDSMSDRYDSTLSMLKELGATGTVNATYTWGPQDSLHIVDVRLYRFPSDELAMQSILGRDSKEIPDGYVAIDGVGDLAVQYNNQLLLFASGELRVMLNSISENVDLKGLATAYADWLGEQR